MIVFKTFRADVESSDVNTFLEKLDVFLCKSGAHDWCYEWREDE